MPAREKKRSASSRGSKRKLIPTEPLGREHIVATAMALVDQEGLSALSMRRLGAELGVDPMAVYYYLPNKQALLAAIVEAVMATIDLTIDHPDSPPEERIFVAARAYRDAMLAHVNALPIVLAEGPTTPAALRPVELLISILRDTGLSPNDALAGMNIIAATVRGTVGMMATHQKSEQNHEHMPQDLPADTFPHLHEAMRSGGCSFDDVFEFGVRALARGLLAEVKRKGHR